MGIDWNTVPDPVARTHPRRDFFRFGSIAKGESVQLTFEEDFHELRESRMGDWEANVRVLRGKGQETFEVLSIGKEMLRLFKPAAPFAPGRKVVITRAEDGQLSVRAG